jgi:hypothetical protein
MKRLFLIEFEKLRANRSSRILIGAYFILLTSIALIAAIKFDIGPIKFHLADQGIFNFPYIWHFNAYIGAWFKIFPSRGYRFHDGKRIQQQNHQAKPDRRT